jgi:H+-transporting ATPase
MSASPGNSRLQVATDANEGAKTGQLDVERGDPHTEKQRFSPNLQGSSSSNDESPENEADEYVRLLKYIDLEAKKEKRRRDEGPGDGEDEEMRRLWYMPWKKVPVSSTSTKGGKVPLSWLETDISQGLSLPEIEMRRARFGYNELERYVKQKRPCATLIFCIQYTNQSSHPVCRVFSRPNPFRYVRLEHVTSITSLISHWSVMELAVLLAAGLRDWVDFGVIVRLLPSAVFFLLSMEVQIGILMLNAFVGWYQEKQAGDIVEKLKAGIAMKAIVRSHRLDLTSSLVNDFTHTRSFVMGKSWKLSPVRSSQVISPSSKRDKPSLRMGR